MLQQGLREFGFKHKLPQIYYQYPNIDPQICLQLKAILSSTPNEQLSQMASIMKRNRPSSNIQNLEEALKQIDLNFDKEALPKMIDHILRHQSIMPKQLPMLSPSSEITNVELTRTQVYCLLSLSFFNMLDRQKTSPNYPPDPCNFVWMTSCMRNDQKNPRKIEKLKCMINYFSTAKLDDPIPLSITRLSLNGSYSKRFFGKEEIPNTTMWCSSKVPLCRVDIDATSKIEDHNDAIMVDFADKLLGGGVLAQGCVQEEIMFACHPESIAAILLVTKIESHECVMIQGVLNYSSYSGYANTFKYVPRTKKLEHRDVLAIDAKNYMRNPQAQYKEDNILRDLNKAFLGFAQWPDSDIFEKNVATGNWGCGIFKGNHYLKFIIQWIAYSQSRAKDQKKNKGKMYYSAFEENISKDLGELFAKLQGKTVGDLATLIFKFGHEGKDFKQYVLGHD